MKLVKSILIAGAALAIAAPAFAGRDGADQLVQERAVQKLKVQKGLAGPTGPEGQAAPTAKRGPASYNLGHPADRVRR